MYTVRETAQRLGMSIGGVNYWERNGSLTPQRNQDGLKVYTEEQVREFERRSAYRVSKAAKAVGVTSSTIRYWEETGLITADHTPGGHRQFSEEQVEHMRAMVQKRDPESVRNAVSLIQLLTTWTLHRIAKEAKLSTCTLHRITTAPRQRHDYNTAARIHGLLERLRNKTMNYNM